MFFICQLKYYHAGFIWARRPGANMSSGLIIMPPFKGELTRYLKKGHYTIDRLYIMEGCYWTIEKLGTLSLKYMPYYG
jgi:hypothetical protein